MSYVSSVSSDVEAYTPVTTSGSVSLSGLGNGTDFDEIIDATIDAESFALDEYEARVDEAEYVQEMLEYLSDEFISLNTSLMEMDEFEEFVEMSSTSTGDAVDVELTGEAEEATHTIVVDQLAQNDIWIDEGDGFSDTTDTVTTTSTTFDFTYAGESYSVDVSAGTTIQGLVDTINNDLDASGVVEADLIYDGDSYQFVLRGQDSGADNAITITATNDLELDAADFTNTQTAQNARIKVDGYPSGTDEWIERDSNSIDDVVDGITFELTDTTDEDGEKITVSYDADAITEKVEEFLDAINTIIYDMQVLTGRVDYETDDEDSDEDTDYSIDSYAMEIMYNEFKTTLATGALGFTTYDEDTGGDLFNALSQIGISTDTEEGSDTYGMLVLDDDEFTAALEEDPEAVALLFSARGTGESDTDDLEVISVVDTVTPAGEHDVEYTVSGGVLVSATIDGEEAEIDGWTILGTGDSSTGLYLSVSDRTDGEHGGTVRVKQGKIGELTDVISDFTDDETGTIAILIDHYEENITSLENQIYNEEARLDALETSLTRKYAALDATLAEYESIGDTLTTLLEQLD